MQESENWVMSNQPWLAVLHDRQQPSTHCLAVTMGGAIVATQLGFSEDTVVESLMGVAVQLCAIGAKSRAAMLIGTVEVDHGAQSAFLSADPAPIVGRPQSCLATGPGIVLGGDRRVHLGLAGHGTGSHYVIVVGHYPFARLACVDICQQN